jgi:hypothetical protein
VYFKIGAVSFEPASSLDPNGWLILNLDKGNQSGGGADVKVLGNIGNTLLCPDSTYQDHETNNAFIYCLAVAAQRLAWRCGSSGWHCLPVPSDLYSLLIGFILFAGLHPSDLLSRRREGKERTRAMSSVHKKRMTPTGYTKMVGSGFTTGLLLLLISSQAHAYSTKRDFNGDGKEDLIMTTPSGSSECTGLASGGFTFDVWARPDLKLGTVQYTTGDFDGDGKTDLIITTTGGSFEYKGLAGGGFTPDVWVKTNLTLGNVQYTTGDFNGDGKTDLIVTTAAGSSEYTGLAAGGFKSDVWVKSNLTLGKVQYTAGDFNGDGKADLVVTTAAGASEYAGLAAGGFKSDVWVKSNLTLGKVQYTTGDFNGDGKTDLIVTTAGGSSEYTGLAAGGFKLDVWVRSNLPLGSVQYTAGDFNGDGKGDLIITTTGGSFEYTGLAAGGFTPDVWVRSNLPLGNVQYVAGDFNGNGRTDLIITIADGSFEYSGLATGGFTPDVWVQLSALFPIGGNSPPPEYVDASHYDDFANASFTVMGTAPAHGGLDENLKSLALIRSRKGLSAAGNLRFTVADWNLTVANVQTFIQSSLPSYLQYPEIVSGFAIGDEPSGEQLDAYAGLLHTVTNAAPQASTDVLNLLPGYDTPAVYIVPRTPAVSNTVGGDGWWVSSAYSLGQTFVATTDSIKKIVLYVDSTQWQQDEQLVLSLYDGPARSALLARRTVKGPNNGNSPVFDLDVTVIPGNSYYWELTHGGGGDGSVGWVVRSTTDSYAGGQAYVNGVSQPNDWFFEIYDQLPGETRVSQLCSDGGTWVDINTSLGQTFVVPAGTTMPLNYVDLYIDSYGWEVGEPLTLTVWDSPSKRVQLASSTVASPDPGLMPRFPFNVRLDAGQSYYMELTHGNASGCSGLGCYQGWVLYSGSRCGDPYASGTGYVKGVPQTWDLVFRQAYGLDWYGEYVDAWLLKGTPKVLSYDFYPFLADGVDRTDYFANLAVIRERGLSRNASVWSYVQSCGQRYDGGGFPAGWAYRDPTAAELRWNIYTQLAYGARGIEYFLYWAPFCTGTQCCDGGFCFTSCVIREDATKNPVLYPAAQDINGEVRALGPKLLGLTSQAVYHTGPLPLGAQQVPYDFFFQPTDKTLALVIAHSKQADGRKAVMVVNRDHVSAHSVSFNVTSRPPRLYEVSKITGAEVASSGYSSGTGTLTVSLGAGDGRLFILPAGY